MRVIKPPTPLGSDVGGPKPDEHVVFLAGSIEMGKAIDWQAQLTAALAAREGVVLNPRRDEWDSTWAQTIDDARFRTQVTWELDGLDRANTIAVWFAPDTKAPITLLELGLHARSQKLVVGCAADFWRRGNVEVVCDRYDVPLFADWEPFVSAVQEKISA